MRKAFSKSLGTIDCFRVIPSQANYIMCEVLRPYKSTKLARELLHEYNILIKDLANKNGLDNGQYVRIAVKTKSENDVLINALKKLLAR